MKNKIVPYLAVAVFLVLAKSGWALQPSGGSFGVGPTLGVPFGASAKLWFDRRNAADFALGAEDGDLHIHADVITHLMDAFPQPPKGTLPLYMGAGFTVKDERDTFFGIRFLGGVSYFLPDNPLEIFAEVAPVLKLAPDLGSAVDGGVGVRYYFWGRR